MEPSDAEQVLRRVAELELQVRILAIGGAVIICALGAALLVVWLRAEVIQTRLVAMLDGAQVFRIRITDTPGPAPGASPSEFLH